MSKKVMCLVLSFVMILSMVSVTGFAADFVQGDFEASHVTFTAGGNAGISVKNNAAGSKNAVFWLGEYEEGVLTESAFVKYTLSAGETWTPSLSVTKNTGSVLKAYIWEDVFNGKAIAPVATYPSSSTEVLYATKDGVKWADFSNDTLSYTINYTVAEGTPDICLYAKDNSTQIIEPASYITGENVIRVVAADGTEKSFTVTLIPEEPADVYGGEKTLTLTSNAEVTVTNNNAGVFGKASWDKTYKFVTGTGATSRVNPMISGGTVGKNVYISFDVAFTSANDSLLIYATRLDAQGTSQGNIALTFGPNGKISNTGWNLTLPTFNLNQWYNVAFVQLADGTTTGRMYINGQIYSTGAWYNVHGTGTARLQVEGDGSTGFYMDNYTVSADGTYDPTLYQMTALTVTNTTDVSLETDGTLIIPEGYTASQLLSAVNVGVGNSATIYADDTYASKVTGSTAAATGSVLVLTNGNGAYRYYPIKCKMELVSVTNSAVVELQNPNDAVGGDLMIDDADNAMTVSELLACLNTHGYTAKVYTDSTKATEVASGDYIPKRNAVLVTSRGADERVYNLKFKNLPDETGINVGTGSLTITGTVTGTGSITANTAGVGSKEASDKVIKILTPSGSYYKDIINYGGSHEVLEFSAMVPNSGTLGVYAQHYTNEERNAYADWQNIVNVKNDGVYVGGTKEVSSSYGRWHNIAIVFPAGTQTGTVYVDGVAYSVEAPATSYGARKGAIYHQGANAGDAAYIDNYRVLDGDIPYTYNAAFEGKPVATSSTVTVDEVAGTITVSDGMTLEELVAALTIDAKYDATVRGYFDSSYAMSLASDSYLENNNVIVIAAKNGYSVERAYAYYTIVIE